MIKNRKQAFSLIEAMISLLILSVILALAFPVLTKNAKIQDTKMHHAVFLYNQQNNNDDDFCYFTEKGASGQSVIYQRNKGNCTKYTFTVPQGVNSVDLALVAGGGGGGGAAGATDAMQELETSDASSYTSKKLEYIYPTRIKDIVIDILTGRGSEGVGYCTKSATSNQTVDCFSEGGSSGLGVVDYVLPRNAYDNLPEVNVREPDDSKAGILVERDNSVSGTADSSRAYFHIYDKDNVNKVSLDNTGFFNVGTIGIAVQNSGQTSSMKEVSMPTADSERNLIVVKSGKGGMVSRKYGYGKGADGPTLSLNCYGLGQTKDIHAAGSGSTASSSASNLFVYSCGSSASFGYVLNNALNGAGSAYAKATITVEHPPVTGAGGVGGTAIRVFNFKVTPGETYTILVGKGGAGGMAGQTGKSFNSKMVVSPTRGDNGVSGSSTAIVDSSGNIVYLVSGGLGGVGGNTNSSADVNNKPLGTINTTESRAIPVVLSSDSQNMNYINNEYNTAVSSGHIVTNKEIDNISRRAVIPNVLNERRNPFYMLSANKNQDLISGGARTYSMGSFNNFATSDSADTTDGLYFRNYFGDDISYAGGLGGFSGLNTKAGCGGLFMGYNNRFKLSSGFAGGGSTFTYNVNDYFDNCSTKTPDGHTAEFIPPSAVNYGQAGAGGGGGGYSMALGSGNGGDGQNGYVMIRWKK